jgi:hypothetical protein
MTLDKSSRIFVFKFFIRFLATEDKKEQENRFDIKLGLLGIMRDMSLLLIHQMY